MNQIFNSMSEPNEDLNKVESLVQDTRISLTISFL